MSTKCPHDGYPMDVDTDWLGRTVVRCVGCDRKKPGHCPDCGVAVQSRKRQARCPKCRHARKRVTQHLRYRRRREAAGKPLHPSPGRCLGCKTAIRVSDQKWCAECVKVQRRKWDRARYERDKAKRLAACRAYYWRNAEAKKQQARERYRKNIVAIKRSRFGQGKWIEKARKAA